MYLLCVYVCLSIDYSSPATGYDTAYDINSFSVASANGNFPHAWRPERVWIQQQHSIRVESSDHRPHQG